MRQVLPAFPFRSLVHNDRNAVRRHLREPMRLLVVGAGSTGGYFGGRLAQAGRDVSFLVRPRRAAALRAQGLKIVSPHGDLTLAPQLLTADQIRDTYDIVLVTVKSFALAAAIEDFAPAVGRQTMILPVLNGMRHVETLSARFGAAAVMGCICLIVATLDAGERIVQLAPRQELAYGEFDGTSSARAQALDAFMQGAIFTARLSSTIEREMWEKWTLLASLGGITCLMRGSIGDVEAAPGGRDFALAFLNEVLDIVRAVGKAPSPQFLETARPLLTAAGSTLTSSMFRDLQNGRPIEADQIIGDLIARAEHLPTAAPLLRAAYANLSVYQRHQLTVSA
jgi:2-dehydropantoate 2-reductase